MNIYVAGFLFNDARTEVALIKKLKPAWQAGHWNGVGGKVEATDESAKHAMTREFLEETGLHVDTWKRFLTITSADLETMVFFHRAFDERVHQVRTMEDEQVAIFPVKDLPRPVIPNLRWLIPLALDTSTFAMGNLVDTSFGV